MLGFLRPYLLDGLHHAVESIRCQLSPLKALRKAPKTWWSWAIQISYSCLCWQMKALKRLSLSFASILKNEFLNTESAIDNKTVFYSRLFKVVVQYRCRFTLQTASNGIRGTAVFGDCLVTTLSKMANVPHSKTNPATDASSPLVTVVMMYVRGLPIGKMCSFNHYIFF